MRHAELTGHILLVLLVDEDPMSNGDLFGDGELRPLLQFPPVQVRSWLNVVIVALKIHPRALTLIFALHPLGDVGDCFDV